MEDQDETTNAPQPSTSPPDLESNTKATEEDKSTWRQQRQQYRAQPHIRAETARKVKWRNEQNAKSEARRKEEGELIRSGTMKQGHTTSVYFRNREQERREEEAKVTDLSFVSQQQKFDLDKAAHKLDEVESEKIQAEQKLIVTEKKLVNTRTAYKRLLAKSGELPPPDENEEWTVSIVYIYFEKQLSQKTITRAFNRVLGTGRKGLPKRLNSRNSGDKQLMQRIMKRLRDHTQRGKRGDL